MRSPTSCQLSVLLLFPDDLLCVPEGHALGAITDLGKLKSSRGDHGVSVVPILQMGKLSPHSGEELTVNLERNRQGPLALEARFFHAPIPEESSWEKQGSRQGMAPLDSCRSRRGLKTSFSLKLLVMLKT